MPKQGPAVLAVGLLAISVASFILAIVLVIYFSTVGTYAALGLVVFGTFSMIISAMLREKTKHAIVSNFKAGKVEDEEELFNL